MDSIKYLFCAPCAHIQLMEEIKETTIDLSQFNPDVQGGWTEAASELTMKMGHGFPRVPTLFRPKQDYTQWASMRKTVQQIKIGLSNAR